MLGDQLAAVYEFTGALVPHGTAQFALVNALDETAAPPALGAGELLLLRNGSARRRRRKRPTRGRCWPITS